MNTSNSIKYALALVPALALSIPAAYAGNKDCDCPCASERTSASTEQNHDRQDRENPAIVSARTRSERNAETSAQAAINASHYMANKPAGGYFSDDLIGSDVRNKRENEVVGSVNELLFDQQGQIKAVIVSTGGILGMGEKDLAISWDQIERQVNGDEIVLTVDFTDDSLKGAPSFARK